MLLDSHGALVRVVFTRTVDNMVLVPLSVVKSPPVEHCRAPAVAVRTRVGSRRGSSNASSNGSVVDTSTKYMSWKRNVDTWLTGRRAVEIPSGVQVKANWRTGKVGAGVGVPEGLSEGRAEGMSEGMSDESSETSAVGAGVNDASSPPPSPPPILLSGEEKLRDNRLRCDQKKVESSWKR